MTDQELLAYEREDHGDPYMTLAEAKEQTDQLPTPTRVHRPSPTSRLAPLSPIGACSENGYRELGVTGG